MRSGVDEIHQAVEFALILLCRTLGLRTALLLGLDATGSQLHIQELSSTEDGIANGPFSARDGIFGASLAKGSLLAIAGPKAGAHVPYYTRKPAIGAVCATPLLDHGNARGLLVVDRESKEPFSAEEEETLRSAAHFVLRAIENERVFVQLDRAKVEQGKLYRAANALASATTEAQVIEAGVSGAREFAAFDFAVVTLFDKNSGEHEICAVSGEGASELVRSALQAQLGLGLDGGRQSSCAAVPRRLRPFAPDGVHASLEPAGHALAARAAALGSRSRARHAGAGLEPPRLRSATRCAPRSRSWPATWPCRSPTRAC